MSDDEGGEKPDKRQRLMTDYYTKKKPRVWYKLKLRHRRKFYKGSVMSVTYDMEFTNITEGTPISELFESMHLIFSDIINRFIHNIESPDRVKLMILIDHEDLVNSIVVPLKILNEFSADYVLSQISSVIQSHKTLSYSGKMSITLGSVTYPPITGKKNHLVEISRNKIDCLKKKKFIKVFDDCPPSDKNCLMRAVCYGYFLNKVGRKFWNQRKLKCKNFDKYAIEIAKMCSIPWNTPISLADIGKIESGVKSMIILVQFNRNCNGFNVMYAGNEMYSDNKIYVLIHPPYDLPTLHAVAVTNPTRLFWSDMLHNIVCIYCKEIVKEQHMCPINGKMTKKCYSCERKNCKDFICGQKTCTITCKLCSRSFLGDDCYLGHLVAQGKQKKSLCVKKYRCLICFQNGNGVDRDLHIHGMKACKNCKCQVWDTLERRHTCNLLIGPINNSKNKRIISFDIESIMNVEAKCSTPDMVDGVCKSCSNSTCTLRIHRPVTVVSFSCCELCRERQQTIDGPGDPCESCGWRCPKCSKKGAPLCSPRNSDSHKNYCGTRRVTFVGENCIKLFIEYLLDKRRKNFSVYGHHMSGYDGYFLLKELENSNFYPREIIMSGSKILYFKIDRINMEFYDSLKIFCLPLRKLPDALLKGKYSSDIQKQKFPMLMLNESTIGYVGEYPKEEDYITSRMSENELQELRDFLASKKGQTFDMKKTLVCYCTMDSYILYLSLLSLQDLVIKMTACAQLPNGVDPLRKCVTISSLALKVFRQVYLKEYHLATLRNTVTDDIIVVNAIKQGEQMTYEMPCTGSVTSQNLTDHELVSTHILRSSLSLLPPVHFDPYKRNRYSKEGLACVLYYEKKLVEKFGRDCVKSFHVLSYGEKPVYLDRLGSTAYLDGLFEVKKNGEEKIYAINFHGCL